MMTERYLRWAALLGLSAGATALGCADDFHAIGDAQETNGGSGSLGGSGSGGGSSGSGSGGGSSGSGTGGGGGTGLGSGTGFGSSAGGGSGNSGGSRDDGSDDSGGGSTDSGSGTNGTGGARGGSGGSGGNAGAAGGLAYCDAMPILEESCSGIVCHGSPGRPSTYVTDLLNTPVQELIDRPANYALVVEPNECPTEDPELLIDSSSPERSLILTKIQGTHACGVVMPNTLGAPLATADVDCFVEWVNGVVAGTEPTANGATITTTTTTGGPELPATFATVVEMITYSSISCVGSDCHGGFEGRLDLRVDDLLYDRLLSWNSEVCGNPVVMPGNPGESALIQVLTTGCGDVGPECLIGSECIPRMPLQCAQGFDCIQANEIEAIRQWIANGAPRE